MQSRICLIAAKKFKLKKIQMIYSILLISMENSHHKKTDLENLQFHRMPK